MIRVLPWCSLWFLGCTLVLAASSLPADGGRQRLPEPRLVASSRHGAVDHSLAAAPALVRREGSRQLHATTGRQLSRHAAPAAPSSSQLDVGLVQGSPARRAEESTFVPPEAHAIEQTPQRRESESHGSQATVANSSSSAAVEHSSDDLADQHLQPAAANKPSLPGGPVGVDKSSHANSGLDGALATSGDSSHAVQEDHHANSGLDGALATSGDSSHAVQEDSEEDAEDVERTKQMKSRPMVRSAGTGSEKANWTTITTDCGHEERVTLNRQLPGGPIWRPHYAGSPKQFPYYLDQEREPPPVEMKSTANGSEANNSTAESFNSTAASNAWAARRDSTAAAAQGSADSNVSDAAADPEAEIVRVEAEEEKGCTKSSQAVNAGEAAGGNASNASSIASGPAAVIAHTDNSSRMQPPQQQLNKDARLTTQPLLNMSHLRRLPNKSTYRRSWRQIPPVNGTHGVAEGPNDYHSIESQPSLANSSLSQLPQRTASFPATEPASGMQATSAQSPLATVPRTY
eukprot:TRINITY_DN2051_c0_g1_i2.p1 TRINITY_DN2051_c0_g1~~TRINITY_DN2051_c0_g1_i2.p1  ORF type:complete len:517 (-),score=92.26 TRINITY_DN2051_c0_g1_i2:370-1920(-)